jgi:hypothetical protein
MDQKHRQTAGKKSKRQCYRYCFHLAAGGEFGLPSPKISTAAGQTVSDLWVAGQTIFD